MNTPIVTKFVSHDIPSLETLKDCFPYKMREKVLAGEVLTREEKDQLYKSLEPRSRSIKLMGYRFDFSCILKTFYVKHYDHIYETFAPDKTAIRNN